jgi:uncharacterized Zn-finger protein
MEKSETLPRVASSELVRQRWPNNKPILTSEETMAKRGMALECTGPNGAFGHREAWFIDIFGRHEMHMLPNSIY